MRKNIFKLLMLVTATLAVLSYASAEGRSLLTEETGRVDSAGTYTLILYGGRHFRDVESLAILDLEGDAYTIEPYAPEFDYRTLKGLSAKDALSMAEAFVGSQYAFRRSILSRILDGSGKTIGYEVRPLYNPLAFGLTDVLDVDYALKNGGTVRAYIRLKSSVERQLFSGSDRDGGGRD